MENVPLGVMFGLGFDTSSEVALLGIASIQGAKGTSIWLILIFPVLFTVGMCLLDTIDGALMMSLYTSTAAAKDQIAILYYSIVLTVITVAVAIVIGVIQLLSLILNVAQPSGRFWDGVEVAGDHYDVIGGAICASFIVFGALSIALYKPWRRRIDGIRGVHRQAEISRPVEETLNLDVLPSHQPTKDPEQGQAIIHNGPQHSPAETPIDYKVGEQVVS
ncbi:50S ribosomal subunit L30 [Physcia stellaris]|nr:50S ribosomal subunit L30 [Physcia stellaris]